MSAGLKGAEASVASFASTTSAASGTSISAASAIGAGFAGGLAASVGNACLDAIGSVKDFVLSTVGEAAKFDSVMKSFTMSEQLAGRDAQASLAELKAASMGMISEQNLMLGMNK